MYILEHRPIADALEKDVDIVVVGRTVDSALALGPLLYEYKWKKMIST
jgi:hypothetical protein